MTEPRPEPVAVQLDARPEWHEVVVVGSGFGGLGAAIQLRRDGVDDVVLLEQADDLGGTWRDNRYPGCACDVPSALYSYSYAPSAEWSRAYAPAAEIWAYLRRVAVEHGVAQRVRTGERLVEARYEADDGTWALRTERGTRLRTRSLVLATGALHEPSLPSLPGLESFHGTVFHTARWPASDAEAVDGRRVAVVGTGASAVQVVPALAGRASHLTVLQRTPAWVLPKADRVVSALERRFVRQVPLLQRALRASVFWRQEVRVAGFTTHPGLLRVAERLAVRHLRRSVRDPAVRAALTPSYRMGCKRILISNDYYAAFDRDDVTLVAGGVARVEPDAVVSADGRRHEVDTLVLATGFAVTEPLQHTEIRGLGGRTLRDAWAGGMQAHLGVTVAGFPNLFFVVGPNSGLGHTSMVLMIEAQSRYLSRCIAVRDGHGARAVEVRQGAQDAFNRELEQRTRRTVWASGCRSWYLDRFGHNRTLWPGSTLEYARRTREPDPAALSLTGART